MPKSRPRPRPKTAPRRDGDAGIIDRLVGLTAMVGEALDDGAPLVTFHEAGAELARVGLTDTLIDLFFAESGRRTRRVAVIDGCSALLTIALGELRLASSDGNANARTALREAADAVERQLGRTSLDAGALMQIVRAFALAELPPPEALKEAMARAVEEHGPQAEALTAASASPQAHFAALAADFDHDAFAIHTDMAASGAAFSPERRISMAAVMALSDEPAMRAAAIGFLLDADETVANSLAQFLADEGALKPSESIVIERIVRLRPWLAPSRQRFVDKALTALRKTALAPVAPPPRTALRWLATPCDGAGTQNLLAPVKTGRKFALASVLIKGEVGVADAWTATERPKRELDAMLAHIASETQALTVTQAYVERRLADALARNIAARSPPPYALVQALETAGVGPIAPHAVAPEALIEELLADVDEAPRDTCCKLDDWGCALGVCDTWFEAGEQVEALLAACETTDDRLTAMLEDYLPGRRETWMSRLAWTAAALKEAAPLDGLWLEIASAARTLGGSTPVASSLLMRRIAERSVEIFEERG